jgi:hypothetical protein
MYTHGLSVSNQKDSPQRQTAVLSDPTDFFSRLENPEELQLYHDHEIFLFLTVLLLFLNNEKCIIGD